MSFIRSTAWAGLGMMKTDDLLPSSSWPPYVSPHFRHSFHAGSQFLISDWIHPHWLLELPSASPAHLLPAVPADVPVHTAGEPAHHGHHLEGAQLPHPHVPFSVCPLHFRGPLHLCLHPMHAGWPALHLTVVVVHYSFASVIYLKPKGPQSLDGHAEGHHLCGLHFLPQPHHLQSQEQGAEDRCEEDLPWQTLPRKKSDYVGGIPWK